MKVLVVVALLVACVNASKLPNLAEKLVPSFAQGYIIKGEDAAPHSAPYIVSLGTNSKKHSHSCGGTIINKDWVLTAAHCIKNPVGMSVMAGLHELANVDSRTQHRVVDHGKIHESYTGGVGPYDIAMLHVSKSFQFNDWVQAAVLPTREKLHTGETQLYGWGQPKSYVLTPAKTLQTVKTAIVPWAKCKSLLPDNAPLHESNVCSDSLQQSISACNGDSGGPLVKENSKGPSEIVGIVSWGYIPCGSANLPSIYTRVSSYTQWIANVQKSFRV